MVGFAFALITGGAFVAGFALALAGFGVAGGVGVLELQPRTRALLSTLKSESPSRTSNITLLPGPSNTLALPGLTIAVLIVQTLTLLVAAGTKEADVAWFLAEGTLESRFAETLSVGIVASGTVLAGALEFAVGTEFALLTLIQTKLSAPSITAHTSSLSITFSTILTRTRFHTIRTPFIVRTLLLASFSTESGWTNAIAELWIAVGSVFTVAFFRATETPGSGGAGTSARFATKSRIAFAFSRLHTLSLLARWITVRMTFIVLGLIIAFTTLLHVLLLLDSLSLVAGFFAVLLHNALKPGERIQTLLRVVVDDFVDHLAQLILVDDSLNSAHMLATWLIRLLLLVWKCGRP